MDVQPDISRVAALFADPTRSRIFLHLLDGRAHPATQIASGVGVAPSTASAHLVRLVAEGALSVEQHGRHRYYRIGNPHIVAAIEAMLPLADVPEPRALTAAHRMNRLRRGRTCYDHAAGELGVELMEGLLRTGALSRTDGLTGSQPGPQDMLSSRIRDAPYELGPSADRVFQVLDIEVLAARTSTRPLIRVCMDWTEQRHHLAGALGALVLDALLVRGWVLRANGRRELVVAEPGKLQGWLGAWPG